MKPITQLLRRPWKTLLGALFSLLACSVACVCLGQYIASVETKAETEANYTTVGLLTSKFMAEKIYDDEGNVIGRVLAEAQPQEVQDLIPVVSDFSFVKKVQQAALISACLPEVTPFNYDTLDIEYPVVTDDAGYDVYGTYTINSNPFHWAAFAIEVEEISEPRLYINYNSIVTNPEDYGYALDVTGTIVETVSVQEGYPDPIGRPLKVTIRYATQEEAATAPIKPQETWLFCGTQYDDLDLSLRQSYAKGIGCRVSEIDWSNIEYFSEEEIETFPFPCIGIYHYNDDPFGDMFIEDAEELDDINMTALTVCTDPSLYCHASGESMVSLPYGQSMSAEEYRDFFLDGGMVRLESSAQEFLEQTDDPFWSKWLQTAQINDHSFPVLGVENLNAVAQFAIEDATISDGRAFTQEEVASGAHVCVISQTLAAANGLQVGDRISLQYFERDTAISTNLGSLPQANPSASYYSPAMGFSSEEAQYQIVGLYRQKNEWEDSPYGFTPNTIFVPSTTFSGGETICGGLFTSIILENGTIDQLEQLAADAGLEGLFACFDQGYSQIMSSLAGYYEVGIVVLRAGLALWLVLTALYLFLFPLQLRPDMRRMWELGTPDGKIRRFALAHNLGILLPGAVLGCLIGLLLFGNITQRIAAAAEVELSLSLSPLTLCLIAAAQLLIATAAVYLVTYFITKNLKTNRGKS